MFLGEGISEDYTNVLVCGFMGAGKSWLLKRLKRSGPKEFNYIDLDQEILKKSGYNTVLKMMKALGEEHFRRIENEILVSLMKKGNNIISLGGGALNKGLNFVIEKRDDILVVWIDTPLDQCAKNLEKDHKNVRPLFKDDSIDVEKLYSERSKIYSVAQVRIPWKDLDELTSFEKFSNYLKTAL